MTYKPLNDNVTIKKSEIEGLGLFAEQDIADGEILGMTHIYDERFPNRYIRLPLGGFFNHSEEPNCTLIECDFDEKFGKLQHLKLVAIQDIKKGEEITTKYKWYKLT